MSLVLYFAARPNLAGFTYTHTFSTVHEPATICLSGSFAETLLSRVLQSQLAAALTAVCDYLEPSDSVPNTEEVPDTNC